MTTDRGLDRGDCCGSRYESPATRRIWPGGCGLEAIDTRETKSTDTDVVTAADRAVERRVVAALRRARPGDGVLGRGVRRRRRARAGAVRWLLDPIDGTVNYLYGAAQYAVSLAAEVDGEVVAGVVRNAADRRGVDRDARRRRYRDGGGSRGSAPDASSTTRWSPPASATTPARRAHQAAVLAGLSPQVPTSAGSARPRWTCARPPRAARRVLSRRAGRRGTTPPGPDRGGGRAAGRPGWRVPRPGRDMVVAAPPRCSSRCTTDWWLSTPPGAREPQPSSPAQVFSGSCGRPSWAIDW